MPRAICARPCRPLRRRRASRHDRWRHPLVRAQQLSRAAGDGLYRLRRYLCRAPYGARRDPRSLRHASDRQHRISGAGAAGDRGPGHLSADHGAARGAALQSRARLFVFRRVIRLCRVRGRHGSLLGAFARARISQFCRQTIAGKVTPSLGPDATGVGWVYQYVVLGAARTLAELRTIQDWYLRYQLTKAEGVAEIASVGGFVQQYQVVIDPQKLQAYGLTLPQITAAIRASNRDVGGRVVENDPQAIATQVLVQAGMGPAVPLGQVAKVQLTQGPPMIRTENAQLVNYIYVDMHDRDIGGYVADAQRAIAQKVPIPPGYRLESSGQFEYLARAQEKLAIVVPVTLVIIFVLLYLNFGRLTETLIVMLSVPFALVGGVWLMAWMQFNMSVAVAVGFIALAGVAAETGVVMLIYLDHALTERRARCANEGRDFTREDLRGAIMQGAVERVRPK